MGRLWIETYLHMLPVQLPAIFVAVFDTTILAPENVALSALGGMLSGVSRRRGRLWIETWKYRHDAE